MKRIFTITVTMIEAARRSRTLLGCAAIVSRVLLPMLLSVTAAKSFAAEESRCLGMLDGAPAVIRQLDAVQACRGADAGCSYLQPAPSYGVLTLICPHSGVRQILFANRLSMLQVRDGALVGECNDGSWQRDAGLPGCYPARGRVAGEP